MVGPAAKRDAVAHLKDIMGLSERRACQIVSADRKMIRYRSCRPPVAIARRHCLLISCKVRAEPRISIAVWMSGAILLPQQRQRHALALQLPRNIRKIWLLRVLWRTASPFEQQLLQLHVVVIGNRYWPHANPRLTRPVQVSRNRRLSYSKPLRNLADRQALFKGQS